MDEIKVTNIKELKKKINALKELGLKYRAYGKFIEYNVDILENDDAIFADKNNFTTDLEFLQKYYNFNLESFKCKTLTTWIDVEGEEKEDKTFIMLKFKDSKRYNYFEVVEVTIYLKIE